MGKSRFPCSIDQLANCIGTAGEAGTDSSRERANRSSQAITLTLTESRNRKPGFSVSVSVPPPLDTISILITDFERIIFTPSMEWHGSVL